MSKKSKKEQSLTERITAMVYPDGGIAYKPISKYVLNRVKELSFGNKEDRDYIRGLSRLEEFIIEGAHSWASGMHYSSLKSTYPQEHDAIYRELKPAEYEKLQEEKRKAQAEAETLRQKRETNVARGLREYELWWLSVGGKK